MRYNTVKGGASVRFCVENDLSLFEFHDSEFSLTHFDGRDLTVSAEMLNIHKGTPQNPSDFDMEITSAQITFINFHSATYAPGRAWKTDADGKTHPAGPSVIFCGQDAIDRILEELRNGISVYSFEKEENGSYFLDGFGIEPYFSMVFYFDSVEVCWDDYKKKAWYELHRQFRYDAVLHTPDGDETVKLMVGCHEEPVYYKGSIEQPVSVNVGCTFEGKEYWGHGSDYLWVDAFADLQKMLPEGISLKCCLTCRHGNMCPVGNGVNEVFCTKDVTITQKSDLYYYTEDDGERAKRSRPYCCVCNDYHSQSEHFYTYSDYLFFLKKP